MRLKWTRAENLDGTLNRYAALVDDDMYGDGSEVRCIILCVHPADPARTDGRYTAWIDWQDGKAYETPRKSLKDASAAKAWCRDRVSHILAAQAPPAPGGVSGADIHSR